SLLIFANLLTFVALLAPLPGAGRWAGYSVIFGLVVAAVQLLMEGSRWQMVPAYVLAALFFCVWLAPWLLPAGSPSKILAGAAFVVGVLGFGASVALPLGFPIYRFVQPTGLYDV